MQAIIEFIETRPAINKTTIDYLQAEMAFKIKALSEKLEKARETARYLYGKKRGAWGRMTYADEKRSAKLDKMREQLTYIKDLYSATYGTQEG